MDHSKIWKAIEASEEKAKSLGITVSTAIVDEHGCLVAFSRMAGAIPVSVKFSQVKAYTAATVGAPTGDIAENAKEGKPFFGFTSVFGGQLTVIGGGFPIMQEEKRVGAIGVGGSFDINQDIECAKAALAELK